MRYRVLVVIVLSLGSTIGMAQEPSTLFNQVNFESKLVGRPQTKASCDATNCTYEHLGAEDQAKYELVIGRTGENYFWTSREGSPLSRTEASEVLVVYSANTQGYVRTLAVQDRCYYVEHLTLGLSTVTYWGSCQAH